MPHLSNENYSVEVEMLQAGAGFVPLESRTLIELKGEDRLGFFHNLCTNEIRRLQPGQGCEAFLCNVRGKTIAHGFALLQEDSLLFSTPGGQSDILLQHLDKYHITEDVLLAVRSESMAEILLSGTKWQAILPQSLELPQVYLQHADFQLEGAEFNLAQVDITGDASFLLRCSKEDQQDVIHTLQNLGGIECAAESLEAARIKAGFPWFGIDITEANLPQEVNRIEQSISFTKGCYLGQETVARIDALGHVNKLLTKLQFESSSEQGEISSGTELEQNGVSVGVITSVARPLPGAGSFALGYVHHEKATSGSWIESAAGRAQVLD